MGVVRKEVRNILKEEDMDGMRCFAVSCIGFSTIYLIGHSGEETIAILTPLRIHPFKKDELATLTFCSEIPKDEMIFLIFAIIFATLKLPAREKPPVRIHSYFPLTFR